MAVDNIARGLAASALKKGGVTTEQLEEGLAKKLDKTGGTVTGDLAIQGDLTVAGTTKSEKTKTLMVEDNVIVTNANKVALQALLSGLAINKDANATYGIMYDPADDTVKFGQGVLDKGGKFTFSEGEGKPLAIRAQSTELNEGHLIKWDSTTNSFVDSGKTVTDFVEVQDVKDMISETIVQETGEATDKVMSQKIVTDSLNNKVNYTDIDNGLSVVDGKVKANIAKIQDSSATEFVPNENGVVTIPNGSRTNFGLLKSDYANGIQSPNGVLGIWPANKEDINKRTNSFSGTLYPDGPFRPIVYNAINYAVKAALTDDKRMGTETSGTNTAFTDTEKDRACEVLGAVRTTALDDVVNELGNYEKSPNYVLIEKVITGYTVLEAAPEDVTTNYASEYKTKGKARNDIDFAYVALTEAETFEAGKYYSKTTESAVLDRHGESGKEPDGTPYSFKNMYFYFENLQTAWEAYTPVHFYNGNSVFPYLFYLSGGFPANRSDVYANIYGNMMTALTTKLNSEMYANSDISIMRAPIKDNMILSGFTVGKIPTDTTVLIYGVRI